MLTSRSFKALLIVGVLVVVFGLIAVFQVVEGQGRISQWTRITYEYEQVGSSWWEEDSMSCYACGTSTHMECLVGNFKKYKVTTHYFSDGNDTLSIVASRKYVGTVTLDIYCTRWCEDSGCPLMN